MTSVSLWKGAMLTNTAEEIVHLERRGHADSIGYAVSGGRRAVCSWSRFAPAV